MIISLIFQKNFANNFFHLLKWLFFWYVTALKMTDINFLKKKTDITSK